MMCEAAMVSLPFARVQAELPGHVLRRGARRTDNLGRDENDELGLIAPKCLRARQVEKRSGVARGLGVVSRRLAVVAGERLIERVAADGGGLPVLDRNLGLQNVLRD